jgi:hypothetical protein
MCLGSVQMLCHFIYKNLSICGDWYPWVTGTSSPTYGGTAVYTHSQNASLKTWCVHSNTRYKTHPGAWRERKADVPCCLLRQGGCVTLDGR